MPCHLLLRLQREDKTRPEPCSPFLLIPSLALPFDLPLSRSSSPRRTLAPATTAAVDSGRPAANRDRPQHRNAVLFFLREPRMLGRPQPPESSIFLAAGRRRPRTISSPSGHPCLPRPHLRAQGEPPVLQGHFSLSLSLCTATAANPTVRRRASSSPVPFRRPKWSGAATYLLSGHARVSRAQSRFPGRATPSSACSTWTLPPHADVTLTSR